MNDCKKRTCVVCGNEFVPFRHNQVTCSLFCRTSRRQAEPEYYEEAERRRKLEAEISVDAHRLESMRKETARARKRRDEALAARDAEYERLFPGMQHGSIRGRMCGRGRSENIVGKIVGRFR